MNKKVKSYKGYSIKRKQRNLAIIFLIPWIIGFLVFSFYPIITTVFYSFTEYNLFEAPKFIGISNYAVLVKDNQFYQSLYNTIYYIIFGVGLQLIFALITALLLNMHVKGRTLYRAMYFLPSLMPPVASALLWVWLLNPKYGLINSVLRVLRLPQPLWLADAAWTKPAIILMALWGIGNTMVIYLAGLGDIPVTYYEAVEIDGGGAWAKFVHVTWPMLTPITLFQIISGFIGGFNIFTQTYIISASSQNGSLGGLRNSLLFYAVNIYQEGFKYLKFGYASALAVVMLIIVLAITLLILGTSKKWVYYGGEN